MAYLGTQPLTGAFTKLADISAGFDGVTTSFGLTSIGGTVAYPQSPANLVISLSGVIQEPTVAYSISGSTISFSTAPVSGESFFGIMLGTTGMASPSYQDVLVSGTNIKTVNSTSILGAGDIAIVQTPSVSDVFYAFNNFGVL